MTRSEFGEEETQEECPSCGWDDKTWCDRAEYSDDFSYWFEDWYCEHCHNNWTIIEDEEVVEID